MAPETNKSSALWAERYSALSFTKRDSNDWYGVKDDDEATRQRANAKAEFLSSESLEEPILEFPKLNEIDFTGTERELRDMLVDAMSLPESDVDVRYEQAARKLAELYRHKEIIRGIALTAERKTLSRDRAGTMTEELFGSPDQDKFAALVTGLRKKAALLSEATPIASELLSLLGEPEAGEGMQSIELKDTTIETVYGDLVELFPGITSWIETVASGEIKNTEDAMSLLEPLLDVADIRAEGWQWRTVAGAHAAETSKAKKEIIIGEERLAKFNSTQLIKTGVHEVLGHAHRRTVGLSNLAFEEGLGVAIEQIITGEKRTPGEQYYTSLALQLGLDRDGQKRNFRETYEVLWRRILIEDLASGKPEDIEGAKQKAYGQCMRTRRGGALDARDISYSEGAAKVHPWLNRVAELPVDERRTILKKVLSYSYDATDDTQVSRMETV